MGFSGGGSNVLKPHTHDGTISQDGGALNMDNVTQASLTNGDLVYSDGVHLQRLAIGSASDTLQVSGGIPAWGSGGASPTISLLGSTTHAGAATTNISVSFAAQSFADVSEIFAVINCYTTDSIQCRVNGLSGSNDYVYQTNRQTSGTVTSGWDAGTNVIAIHNLTNTGQYPYSVIRFTAGNPTMTASRFIRYEWKTAGNTGGIEWGGGYWNGSPITSIDEVSIGAGFYAGFDIQAGSSLSVYSVSR